MYFDKHYIKILFNLFVKKKFILIKIIYMMLNNNTHTKTYLYKIYGIISHSVISLMVFYIMNY